MSAKRKHKHIRWRHSDHLSGAEHEMLAHDPPLSPHDEAVFLLHIAAEVEHSLLVQYLYAAYSLKGAHDVAPEHQAMVRAWKSTLLGIAREEMGHLVTVQNLLRLIGAPVTLDREDYPFRTDLYPFHFRLEPLSKDSLAKYVVAEMPHIAEPSAEVQEISRRASNAAALPVNRIGTIYARIAFIFSPPAGDHALHLTDADFAGRVDSLQAHFGDWGAGSSILIPEIRDREEALEAIAELSEQGEGLFDSSGAPSHYQRFLDMYRQFPGEGEWEPVHAVPADPSTNRTAGGEDEGRITHPHARRWAQLANMRYRLLLAYLSHFLQSDGPLVEAHCEPGLRGFLRNWTFDEMRRLGQIAGRLATMPRFEHGAARPERAGVPFELPYTINLPDREADKWRHHINVLSAAIALEREIQRDFPEAHDPMVHDLVLADHATREIMQAVLQGEALPGPRGGFARVVQILESSVHGFPIGAHHNFWRNCSRDEFVNKRIFGNPLIARAPEGGFDAANSNLVKALRGEMPFDAELAGDNTHFPRMPAHRPPVPDECIEFVYGWIMDGCPED
ncbi:MAG TPA: ferritin-like protein [Chloroflexia bacterium]|nr:ferritin-like protein [Chloroflexia bacterium]